MGPKDSSAVAQSGHDARSRSCGGICHATGRYPSTEASSSSCTLVSGAIWQWANPGSSTEPKVRAQTMVVDRGYRSAHSEQDSIRCRREVPSILSSPSITRMTRPARAQLRMISASTWNRMASRRDTMSSSTVDDPDATAKKTRALWSAAARRTDIAVQSDLPDPPIPARATCAPGTNSSHARLGLRPSPSATNGSRIKGTSATSVRPRSIRRSRSAVISGLSTLPETTASVTDAAITEGRSA